MSITAIKMKTRSGDVDFVKPVLGFETHRLFSFEDYKEGTPFMWMISSSDENLKFIAINVFDFYPEYDLKLSRDDSELLGYDKDKTIVLSLVSIPEIVSDMTVNLSAPIVINFDKMMGGQFINMREGYNIREFLIKRGENNADSFKKGGREDNNKR
jgi:flagellar assembly factor FliW